MSGKVFLRAQNEETVLLRVMRVLAKQGVEVKELNMKTQADELEIEILLNTEADVNQMTKILSKQVAVLSVNALVMHEQAAV